MARSELSAAGGRAALERRRERAADRRAGSRLRAAASAAFVEAAWPVIEPATRFVPGWHIDAICDHLQAA